MNPYLHGTDVLGGLLSVTPTTKKYAFTSPTAPVSYQQNQQAQQAVQQPKYAFTSPTAAVTPQQSQAAAANLAQANAAADAALKARKVQVRARLKQVAAHMQSTARKLAGKNPKVASFLSGKAGKLSGKATTIVGLSGPTPGSAGSLLSQLSSGSNSPYTPSTPTGQQYGPPAPNTKTYDPINAVTFQQNEGTLLLMQAGADLGEAIAALGDIVADQIQPALNKLANLAGVTDLYNQGMSVRDQMNAVIQSYDEANPDSGLAVDINNVEAVGAAWLGQANAAIAAGGVTQPQPPPNQPPPGNTPPPDGGGGGGDAGGGGGGGGGDAGVDWGGGGGGGMDSGGDTSSAELEAEANATPQLDIDDFESNDAYQPQAEDWQEANTDDGDYDDGDDGSYQGDVNMDDVMGDFGTGNAPSVDLPEMGPAAGGTHYTDAATITAVQQALKAHGYSVKVDGKFGPETEAALFKFGGEHGPPDDAMLAKLGVSPGGGGSSRTVARSAPRGTSYASIAPGSGSAPAATTAPQDGWLAQPLWPGAPIKRWQGIVGGVALGAVIVGVAGMFRR